MSDETLALEDAVGVQVYSTEKIDPNMWPNKSPYPLTEGQVEAGEADMHEDAKAVLEAMGVVFYRDSLNADGLILADKVGKMFYSQFYIGDDGIIGRIFRLNVDRTVVKVTPQAVTWQ